MLAVLRRRASISSSPSPSVSLSRHRSLPYSTPSPRPRNNHNKMENLKDRRTTGAQHVVKPAPLGGVPSVHVRSSSTRWKDDMQNNHFPTWSRNFNHPSSASCVQEHSSKEHVDGFEKELPNSASWSPFKQNCTPLSSRSPSWPTKSMDRKNSGVSKIQQIKSPSLHRQASPDMSVHCTVRDEMAFSAQKNKTPRTSSPQRSASPNRVASSRTRGYSAIETETLPFDICKNESCDPVQLKLSLLEINREKRKEAQRSKIAATLQHLEPGMVLLKNYISHQDQVKIIENCRTLGVGIGGFYRPQYRDGAKLHLQMMCLGKNWDPESRLYEDRRPFDDAVVPKLPELFKGMVERAIQFSHDFLKKKGGNSAEDELPKMSPDICIINFYSKSGKLGLHQDRDESKESLQKGLPVVSFSLGDSAEFLYGNKRDVDNAKKILLESGDVLIFGGKSRLIYHGVSAIISNTVPRSLIEETKLRPGRLNLTFRKE